MSEILRLRGSLADVVNGDGDVMPCDMNELPGDCDYAHPTTDWWSVELRDMGRLLQKLRQEEIQAGQRAAQRRKLGEVAARGGLMCADCCRQVPLGGSCPHVAVGSRGGVYSAGTTGYNRVLRARRKQK